MLDVNLLKKDFLILKRKINGKDLVYLDNAATSQKPQQVIGSIVDYYTNHNANVHRGIHTLSEEATQMYENARKTVANFIGARYPEEIIFTKGTTESINRAAIGWVLPNLKQGDVILTTTVEHHSNLIPWQEEAKMVGAELKFIEIPKDGKFPMDKFKESLNEKVKLVTITHASNVTGNIFPVKEVVKEAKKFNAVVVVDGAQAVPHFEVNMQSLNCDFYAFSAHKMLGPMGIGVLYAKKEILEKMEPYEYGGGMINSVNLQGAIWAEIPEKFEAGTPNVEGAVGLAAAIDYLQKVGMKNVRDHETEITKYALEKLSKIKDLQVIGSLDPNEKTGLISFTVTGIHAHDISAVLNSEGIAVRSGYHCAEPFHKQINEKASVRASWYLYNTKEDIDKLILGIEKAITILK